MNSNHVSNTHILLLKKILSSLRKNVKAITIKLVVRDKWVPNAKVALDVDSARFFDLLIGRLAGK